LTARGHGGPNGSIASANPLARNVFPGHLQQFGGWLVAGAAAVMEIVGQAGFNIAPIGNLNEFEQLDHVRSRDGGNGLEHVQIPQGKRVTEFIQARYMPAMQIPPIPYPDRAKLTPPRI
jgi:hypothetical protein